MKVIFLDIDGVLNLRRRERDKFGSLFHKAWQNNLNRVVEETGAKIVISSTWRMSGLKVMQDMWKARKLAGEIIDITPHFYNTIFSAPRGIEIDHWLREKGFVRINWSKEKQLEYLERSQVKNYVIFDDDSDMLLCQSEHFLRCSRNHDHKQSIEGYGLTKEIADEAIYKLKSNIIDLYY